MALFRKTALSHQPSAFSHVPRATVLRRSRQMAFRRPRQRGGGAGSSMFGKNDFRARRRGLGALSPEFRHRWCRARRTGGVATLNRGPARGNACPVATMSSLLHRSRVAVLRAARCPYTIRTPQAFARCDAGRRTGGAETSKRRNEGRRDKGTEGRRGPDASGQAPGRRAKRQNRGIEQAGKS